MIDADYADAVTGSGGGRVCGYRLSFLTPRHMLGLCMMESPYVVGGRLDFRDTLLAARILSTRTEKQWRAAVMGAGHFWKVGVFFRALWYGRGKWWRHCTRLKEWMAGEMIMPQVIKGEDSGRVLSSPWLQLLVSRMARECGMPLSEAWWQRFADGSWSNIAWQEMDGAEIRLMDQKLRQEFLDMGWKEDEL